MPSCSNDVAEGMNVVTTNDRLLGIRKMIVQLLLSSHPQECLGCIRNQRCELQTLAADFDIRSLPFPHAPADHHVRTTESGTLVRDIRKCIKCGRCIDVCQEVQTVRAINASHRGFEYEVCTPYDEKFIDSTCVFCGKCEAVCPVGAIFEYDQCAEVWTALNNKERKTAVLVSAPTAAALDGEFGLAPGTVTGGKIVTALKRMGFYNVYDTDIFTDAAVKQEFGEFLARIKNQKSGEAKLPMISGSAPGLRRFVEQFYPKLANHLYKGKSPQKIFGDLMKTCNSAAVSVMPNIAGKFEAQQRDGKSDVDTVLIPRELARMMKMSGIDFRGLPETPFDRVKSESIPEVTGSIGVMGGIDSILRMVHKAYTGGNPVALNFKELSQGVKEAEVDLPGTKAKVLLVIGLANARTIMDSVIKGECDAVFVGIMDH